MKKQISIVLLCIYLCFSCSKNCIHKKINFNKGWQFSRIENLNAKNYEIKNQGSDWSSQFNIEHIASDESKLFDHKEIEDEKKVLSKLNWKNVELPHTAKIENLVVKNQWLGVCYYKKEFELDIVTDKDYLLKFQAAMHLSHVWVNAQYVGMNAGGYTPFVFDITKFLKTGVNKVLVRLDNRNNPLIPPGKPIEKLDFCYYSGIYRDVDLLVKNKIHITDEIFENKVASGGVFVKTESIENNCANISINVDVRNNTNETTDLKIINEIKFKNKLLEKRESNLVLSSGVSNSKTTNLSIQKPNLWSIEKPNLYKLVTTIQYDGNVVDQRITDFGIRTISFSRNKGFLLNNKPVRLVGSNRHMEYPYLGNAISKFSNYRDLVKIKEAGFNVVRLGHYPQDPSVYKFCDEHGLLIINPTPGWQFFNSDSTFCENTYTDIKKMIRRDRNHPSVIMWETILNEAWPPVWWKNKANEIAHNEYSGNQFFTSGDMYGYYGWDVLYNDWKNDHTRPNDSKKPGFIREYADYEFGGHYSTTRVTRKDGEQALLRAAWNQQWSHNKHRKQYPWTTGDAVWSMYDYNRGCCDNICYSGVSEINRLPKFGYYFYRSQMSVGENTYFGKMKPMMFLANYWTNNKDDKLVVYSNVDEVEVLVDGKSVAKQNPDHGKDTEYAKTYEERVNLKSYYTGGNASKLKHPPFTFDHIKWKDAKIQLKGYQSGKVVVEKEYLAPKSPQTLEIEIDYSGYELARDVKDEVFVYVKVVDKNGSLCIQDNSMIELEVVNAKLISPKMIQAEAGIASFLIQSITSNKEEIVLKATSKQLESVTQIID